MTPDLLHRVGLVLYGPQWRAPLSEALGVDERTVRRWAKGTHLIPDGVRADLLRLIGERGGELRALRQDVWSEMVYHPPSGE